MADVFVLNVNLHGKTIGTLTHVGGDRTLFSFTDEYIADESRPTLGLRFRDEYGQLITGFAVTQKRLLPFFSNLLPEGTLRAYLARRAGVNQEREFHLLWALGQDLPGAITVEPANGEEWPPATERKSAPEAGELRKALRFSLAGVQLKFSAVHDDKAGKGLTIPASGVGGSWIVKLPSLRFEGMPENEYALMTLARLVGIDVPEIQLIDIDAIANLPEGIGGLPGPALAIRRFDRTANLQVHTEDFAQVFGVYPEEKYRRASYRNIATVLGAEADEADAEEFIRRLTFCTLTGNADMHLKNWSLIYPDKRTPALAPAYDLVSTIPYIEDEEAAFKFARTRRFDGYTPDELSYLAGKAGLAETPVLNTARRTVERFRDVWQREKNNLPQRKQVTERSMPISGRCGVGQRESAESGSGSSCGQRLPGEGPWISPGLPAAIPAGSANHNRTPWEAPSIRSDSNCILFERCPIRLDHTRRQPSGFSIPGTGGFRESKWWLSTGLLRCARRPCACAP